jgi:hypothetical protein
VRVLSVENESTFGEVIDYMRRRPVLLQLPQVYTLIAPATGAGAKGLDEMKSRLPGKNYGSAVGDIRSFWEMIQKSSLPTGIEDPAVLEGTEDVFYRCQISGKELNSKTVRSGSHQTLVLGGHARALMREVEAAFQETAEPELFGGHSFSAPLITSCNVSGDPLGSITDEARALKFMRERGVELWVRPTEVASESGSYPILELSSEGIYVGREGPGLERILGSMPEGSRPGRVAS